MKYNPNDYLLYLFNSEKKHVLVEGKSEKVAFENLRFELEIDKKDFQIDSAEDLINFEDDCGHFMGLGNRRKIEEICLSVYEHNSRIKEEDIYIDRFVGFVDREFDKFRIGETIYDDMHDHQIKRRLVFSRGHSIENYLFDIRILFEALREFGPEYFQEAINLYQEIWPNSLKLACAVSVASYQMGRYKLIRNSIKWELLNINSPIVSIDQDSWKRNLCDINHLERARAEEFFEHLNVWISRVENIDLEIMRWVCHGHIGFSLLMKIYAACLFIVSGERYLANAACKQENDKLNTCIIWWTRRMREKLGDYPLVVFSMLGFEI